MTRPARQVEPDVDEVDRAARRAAGSTRCATLWVPKVTVTVGRHVRAVDPPVSTSTPRGTSTATTGTPAQRGHERPRRRDAARPAADPDDPVDDHVGPAPRRRPLDDPAAGARQRGQAGLVGRVRAEQQRLDPRAAAGEQRAGVQRVAAVVAGRRPAAAPGAP